MGEVSGDDSARPRPALALRVSMVEKNVVGVDLLRDAPRASVAEK
jgi:hypothetical protein